MRPSLLTRLGKPDRASAALDDERALMAPVAFYLLAFDATIGLVTLALPGNEHRDNAQSLSIALAVYALALVPLIGFTRLPIWAFDALGLAGTAAASAAVYYGGEGGGIFALYYFWIVLYAAYFFSPARTALQIAFVATAYGLVVATGAHVSATPVSWAVMSATLAVVAGLVILLKGRLERVIAEVRRSHAEVQRRSRQQAAETELGRHALLADDVSDLLDRAVVEVACLLGVELVAVWEARAGNDVLRLKAVHGAADLETGTTVQPSLGSLVGRALATADPVVVESLGEDERAPFPASNLTGGLAIAIPGPGYPRGVLAAYAHTPGRFASDDEVAATFLRSVANIIAAAMARAQTARLQAGQSVVLEMITLDRPLPETLDALSSLIEKSNGQVASAVILLDGELLHVASAPRLSPEMIAAIEQAPDLPPETGDVIALVADRLREVAGRHGLTARITLPIEGGDAPLGMLAVFHEGEVHAPQLGELKLYELVRRLASIAIEHSRRVQALRGRESQARTTSERLGAIIEASPAAIFELGLDRTVRLWNRTAEEIFGWSSEQARGHVLPVPAPSSSAAHRELLERAAATEGAAAELRYVRSDGIPVEIAVSVAPVRDSRRRVRGLMGVAIDIGEQRRLERELRQTHKMEALGRLAGGVAHDFNNILLAIKSQTWLLSATLDESSEERELVGAIETAVDRAGSLTRQLLAFSRNQPWEPIFVDVSETVSEMVHMLDHLIDDDVELRTVLEDDLGYVLADRSQIEQVVVNLVVNAREAMPRGGRLTIATYRSEQAEHAGEEPAAEAGHAVLEVKDTGDGIPAEERGRIFDPFFTTKPEGTGLGLATVHGIVERIGGRISVRTEPGEGTSFFVHLPLADAQAARNDEVHVDRPDLEGSETILLVEDDGMVLQPVRAILGRAGYRVLAARGASEAIDFAEHHSGPIDVLISDVVMPGLSGPALRRKLTSARPEIKVLYVSGYLDRAEGFRNAFEIGADVDAAFLQKPFSADDLLSAVRELLNGDTESPPLHAAHARSA
jgi:PAS domain S-box-containing protein